MNHWIAQANQALADLPQHLDLVDWRVAIVLAAVGLLSILYGYKIFKAVITLYCAVVGLSLGWWITVNAIHQPAFWWVGALAGGIILGLIAWPLVNFFVGFWGAVAGGLLGYGLARATGDPAIIALAVLVGVVLCAILALVLLRLMIIVTTSVVGAYMLVTGLFVLLSLIHGVAKPLREGLLPPHAKHYILPLAIFIPALLGVIVQLYQSEPASKGAKKSSDDKDSDDE